MTANITILRRDMLDRRLDEPYLSVSPPKSTGRELFNMPWLQSKLGLDSRAPNRVATTATLGLDPDYPRRSPTAKVLNERY